MSSETAQSKAAGEQASWQADLSAKLSAITLPELQQLMGKQGLGGMLSSTDALGRMGVDRDIRQSALSQLNQGYGQAGMSQREAINYGGLRSGEGRLSPGAMNSSLASAATSLDRDRSSALRNLEFASAQSSMADYNKVLQLLGQGQNTALSLAGGFSGASGSAIAGLSNQSQAGGIIGGAATGAGIGTSIYPGWGTAIGAVVGGVAGGLTSP